MAILDDIINAVIQRVLTTSEKDDEAIQKRKIILSDNEEVVKIYHCSEMNRPKVSGYLTVTNKRVIFHGYGKGSRIVDETQVSSISGISTFYGGYIDFTLLKFALIGLIIGLIMCSLTTIPYVGIPVLIGYPVGLLLIGCAIIFGMSCRRKAFFLNVYASQSSPAISVGEGGTLGGNNAVFSLIASPTDETDLMMLELGALISDIQTQGNLAINKWRM